LYFCSIVKFKIKNMKIKNVNEAIFKLGELEEQVKEIKTWL
jgi:hypothetical protein